MTLTKGEAALPHVEGALSLADAAAQALDVGDYEKARRLLARALGKLADSRELLR